ncbi:MAG: membrane protein insertion efficiency factor YidD [Patescibacteria group bacterium]
MSKILLDKNFIAYYLKVFLLGLIKLYQKTFSPDHGLFSRVMPYSCRFTPTCSEYGYQAISKYGIIKGGWLSIKRIFRCNPWNRGGHDPLI